MVIKSVYVAHTEITSLITKLNQFCQQYNVSKGIVAYSHLGYNIDIKMYECFMQIDFQSSSRANQMGETSFNVMTPEQEAEIKRLQEAQQQQQQEQALPMPA